MKSLFIILFIFIFTTGLNAQLPKLIAVNHYITERVANPATNECSFSLSLVISYLGGRLNTTSFNFTQGPLITAKFGVENTLVSTLDKQLITLETSSLLATESNFTFTTLGEPMSVGPFICRPKLIGKLPTPVLHGTVYDDYSFNQQTILEFDFANSTLNESVIDIYGTGLVCATLHENFPLIGVKCIINRLDQSSSFYYLNITIEINVDNTLPSMFNISLNINGQTTANVNSTFIQVPNVLGVANDIADQTTLITQHFQYPAQGPTTPQIYPTDVPKMYTIIRATNVNSIFISNIDRNISYYRPMPVVLKQGNSTTYINQFDHANVSMSAYYCDSKSTYIRTSFNTYLLLNMSDYLSILASIIKISDRNMLTISIQATVIDGYALRQVTGFFDQNMPRLSPFSIINGIKYSVTIPIVDEHDGYLVTYVLTRGFGTMVPHIPPLPSSKVTINRIDFISVSDTEYLFLFDFTSLYPILLVKISTFKTISLESIYYGNSTNGQFQTFIPKMYDASQITISFQDSTTKTITLNPSQIYNTQLMQLPTNLEKSIALFGVNDIKNITFTQNDFIFTGSSNVSYYQLYLEFYATNISNLNIMFAYDEIENTFQGQYDYKLKQYVFDLWIASSMIPGMVQYKIIEKTYNLFSIDSSLLISKLGQVANISLSNPYGDLLRPQLTLIAATQRNISFNGDGQATLEWKLGVYDSPSGFKWGRISVVSDLNSQPVIITFNESNRISGDDINGVYRVSLNVSECATQYYRIKDVYLNDNYQFEVNSLKDAMVYLIGTTFENNNPILLYCINPIIDTTGPILESFEVSPTFINVGSKDRLVTFNMKVSDNIAGTGISGKPYLILTPDIGDPIYVDFVKNTPVPNKYMETYNASVYLPYGYSLNRILINIYGIYDYSYNYLGRSAYDLQSDGFTYAIDTVFSLESRPEITSSLPISNVGGSLIIYGYRFQSNNPSQTKIIVKYEDNKEKEFPLEFVSGGFIKSVNIGPITENPSALIFVKVKRLNDRLESDYHQVRIYFDGTPFPVTPSPTPTPTATTPNNSCIGTPPCNNRGVCKEYGCECNYPYYGPSCSSEIIIINPPIPQDEPTIGTNITNGNGNIFTNIQIMEIREIDNLNNIIKRHNISQWDLSVNNSNNPTFQYKSQLSQTTTNLIVTISYFYNQTNIQFGDRIISMQPSSIKYTIDISKYEFQQKTNQLQVVMDSSIKGNENSCSSKQYGSNTNSNDNIQWIKINIDKTSLYGRFIDFGLIDGRQQTIQNMILEDSNDQPDSQQFRSIKVGITIPQFSESVFLDPDFSNLIDINDESVDYLCKSKDKLSSGAIAGIVVGSIVFVSILIGGSIFVLKKRKSDKERNRMAAKLKVFNQNKD